VVGLPNSNGVIFLVLVLLVVIVLSSTYFIKKDETPKTSTTIPTTTIPGLDECDKIVDEIKKPWCYVNIAIERNDSIVCDMMRDTFTDQWIDTCYTWIARGTGIISNCDKISEPNDIASCYAELAEKTQNVSICDLMPDEYPKKWRCYLNLRDITEKSLIQEIFSCEKDADCVPADCGSSKECINIKFKPDCEEVASAPVCEPYTMDCCQECGCKCSNNTCTAIVNNGTFS